MIYLRKFPSFGNQAAALIATVVLSSCSGGGSESSGFLKSAEDTPDRAPSSVAEKKPLSLQDQLSKRFAGQSEFLNIDNQFLGGLNKGRSLESASVEMAADAPGGAPSRAEESSDVYKIIDKKHMAVINRYRGLEIVQYEGEEQLLPKRLIGKTGALNDCPSDQMYTATSSVSETGEEIPVSDLIVLVNEKNEVGSCYWGSKASKVLIFDISDLSKPVLRQQISLEGQIKQSVKVGDALYLGTSIPVLSSEQGSSKPPLGRFYGISLNGLTQNQGTAQVRSKLDLQLPVAEHTDMRISYEKLDGTEHYYALVALNEVNQNLPWQQARRSQIEVIDISSPTGVVSSLFAVAARGVIGDKSAMSVHGGVLDVASSFRDEKDQIQRIAVERFRFPKSDGRGGWNEVLDIEAAKALMAEVEGLDKLIDHLNSQGQDPKEVLTQPFQTEMVEVRQTQKQSFARITESSIQKLVADQLIIVEPPKGQHADLRDVRFFGDMLYVIWVPTSRIDPIEPIYVGDTQGEMLAFNNLRFDGWIDRVIPLTFENTDYLLGIGWKQEAVANSNGGQRRYPMFKVFEVQKTKGENGHVSGISLTAKEDLDLSQAHIYADFNDLDKSIPYVYDSKSGSGALMFVAHQQGGAYTSGAKFIGFDLAAAASGKGKVFAEGALLNAGRDSVSRAFANNSIGLSHTLSDTKLASFDVRLAPGAIGAADQVAQILGTILEMSRNIQTVIPLGDRLVQVVSDQIIEGDESLETVSLRSVPLDKSDLDLSELSDQDVILLKGESYVDYLPTKKGLIFLTQINQVEQTEEEVLVKLKGEAAAKVSAVKGSSYVTYRVREMSLDQTSLVLSENKTDLKIQQSSYLYLKDGVGEIDPSEYPAVVRVAYPSKALQILADGHVLLAPGGSQEIRLLNIQDKLVALETPNDGKSNNSDICGIKNVNGKTYEYKVIKGKVVLNSKQSYGVVIDELGLWTLHDQDSLEALQADQNEAGIKKIRPALMVSKNFISPILVNPKAGEQADHVTWECQPAINIPGSILAFTDSGLITNDERILTLDIKTDKDDAKTIHQDTKEVLSSLNLKEGQAYLADMMSKAGIVGDILEISPGTLATMERSSSSGEAIFRGIGISASGTFESVGSHPIYGVNLDENEGESAFLETFLQDPSTEGGLLGILRTSGKSGSGRIVPFKLTLNPEVSADRLKLNKVLPSFELEETLGEDLIIPGFYQPVFFGARRGGFSYYRTPLTVLASQVNDETRLTIPNGYYGVHQYVIAKNPK